MMSSQADGTGRDDRVKADAPIASPVGSDKDTREGTSPSAVPSAAASALEDEIDDDTAGDGVAFFEGGDGREDARGDMERNG